MWTSYGFVSQPQYKRYSNTQLHWLLISTLRSYENISYILESIH